LVELTLLEKLAEFDIWVTPFLGSIRDSPRFREVMDQVETVLTVRRLVNLRIKSNATYWLEQSAEAILHLRAVLKAGRWEELERHAFDAAPSLMGAA